MTLSHNDKFLNGWKEIAGYLERGIRTVQRWEKQLEMPVRRPKGKNRSAVVSLRAELDEWLTRAPLRLRPKQEDLPKVPARVLIVEDSGKDLYTCVSVLRAIGVSQLDVISTVSVALAYLAGMASGKLSKPDVIILELALPSDSGFEILHYWKSTPALKSIPIVVWTAIGYPEQHLCTTFGVHQVVPKRSNPSTLEVAVRSAVAAA